MWINHETAGENAYLQECYMCRGFVIPVDDS